MLVFNKTIHIDGKKYCVGTSVPTNLPNHVLAGLRTGCHVEEKADCEVQEAESVEEDEEENSYESGSEERDEKEPISNYVSRNIADIFASVGINTVEDALRHYSEFKTFSNIRGVGAATSQKLMLHLLGEDNG